MSLNKPDNWPALTYFDVKPDDDDIEVYRLSQIPDEHMKEAYWECGSHPEVVGRVWDTLGDSIPDDCCAVVNGHNCLLHDQTDILFAVCMGTQYAIRVPANKLDAAETQGLPRTCDWSGSHDLVDLRLAFGPNWYFGNFCDDEPEWIELVYRELNTK